MLHIGYQKAASTFLQQNIFKEEFGLYSPYAERQPEIVNRFILVNQFEFDPGEVRKFFDEKFALANRKRSGW